MSNKGNVGWLQEPSNFCGHKPKKGGHRMVSGIVRAKVKKEIQHELDSEQKFIDDELNPFSFEDYCSSCDYFLDEDECPHYEEFKDNKLYEFTEWKDINCNKYCN